MVKMASKLSFGTAAADWQERINMARMREERAERTRKFMRKYGIPALLAARPDNTRYLTGIRGAEFMPQLWYVLFFAEHDPVVFAHAGTSMNWVFSTTLVQNYTDDRFRGRVFAADVGLLTLSIAASSYLAGAATDLSRQEALP